MRTPRRRRGALPSLLTLSLVGPALVAAAALPAVAVDDPPTVSADDALLSIAPVGTYATGQFDESAAEIVAFDPSTDRAFVVNAQSGRVDVLDAADPTSPTSDGHVDTAGTPVAGGGSIPSGAVANSVAVRADGLVVVAVEAPEKTDPGWLMVVDGRSLTSLGAVRVGALPDMVTLTADGTRAVVANEGEPSDDYAVDPEGSVAVVDLPGGLAAPGAGDVRIADFHGFEAGGTKTLPDGVRIFGPEVDAVHPVSANLEPEYVALDDDGTTAWVTLQENDAIAEVDLDSATVTTVRALGSKDHSVAGQGLDPSDRDGAGGGPAVKIGTRPVRGLFMPDSVHSYTAGGRTYLVTANEGDAREWGDYVEPARVKDLGDDGLAPICADAPAADLTGDDQLGRLNVSTASGLSDDGSCYEELYSFGARSFSIWSADGDLVFDSGDAFERITAEAAPDFFNSNHSESNLEGRSDDKGPEPEAVTVGTVGDRTYAFVGFERVGGIAVFDVTTPADSSFVTYLNNRDFSVSVEDAADVDAALAQAGDLGPESIAFVDPADSPSGKAMLVVGNEVSGTTTFFDVTAQFASTSAPVVEGDPTVGSELTATVGAWSPAADFTYTWLRDGEPIDGATSAAYTPTSADAGAAIMVRVTGTAPSHAATSRESAAVQVVAAPGDGDGGTDGDGGDGATGGPGEVPDASGGLLPDAGAPVTWLALLAALAAVVGGGVLVRRRAGAPVE